MFTWSVGMSTPFIMIVQMLLVIFLIIVVVLAVIDIPPITGMDSIEALIQDPSIIFSVFLIITIVAPVTEELFKTLAIWPLMGLRISTREGYVAGLMSGAAFALFEGAMYAVQATMLQDNDWVFFILGRLGGQLAAHLQWRSDRLGSCQTWQDKRSIAR